MAATQTPPSPPEETTEPNLDRLPTRYDSRSSRELLDIIDDLEGSRFSARVREAIWVSLILHLVFFWLFFYGPRPNFMQGAKVVNPLFLKPEKQPQMTYLEMPKDLQQQKPRPTNIISNQNHRAQTKHPEPKPKTIQQLEAMRRAGIPAPPPQRPQPQHRAGQPQPRPQPQAQPRPAQPRPAQPPIQTHATPPAPPSQGSQSLPSAPSVAIQTQKQAPQKASKTKPTIAANHPNMSVGEIIRQAERNAVKSNGQNGDYGQNAPLAHPGEQSAVEVLSDTMGVDFGPYLQHVVDATRQSWYLLIPEAARAPLLKQGKVAIQFLILPDGSVKKMELVLPSGDVSLDRAAWGGITGAAPFPPLPKAFKGPYLALRFYFLYNENTGQWERQP